MPIEINNTSDLPLPSYQTEGSAGFDLRANLDQPVVIEPKQQAIVPTGIRIALPVGYELQLRGRSGLAAKHGIGLVNGVGTIDSDYRGEIHMILINHGNEPFTINHGDRIAQGIVARYEQVAWKQVDALDETERGQGGLGSTGKA
jgi:dUTP pyrophosphatase